VVIGLGELKEDRKKVILSYFSFSCVVVVVVGWVFCRPSEEQKKRKRKRGES
jgi:hypothetical protein